MSRLHNEPKAKVHRGTGGKEKVIEEGRKIVESKLDDIRERNKGIKGKPENTKEYGLDLTPYLSPRICRKCDTKAYIVIITNKCQECTVKDFKQIEMDLGANNG